MTEKTRNNPLSPYAFWLTIIVFGFFGITYLTKQQDVLSLLVLPITFFCSLFFTVWLTFQYRTGYITLYNKNGIKNVYKRKENPVLFFLIFVSGMLMGIFLIIALGSELFFGCEGSLINSCNPTFITDAY